MFSFRFSNFYNIWIYLNWNISSWSFSCERLSSQSHSFTQAKTFNHWVPFLFYTMRWDHCVGSGSDQAGHPCCSTLSLMAFIISSILPWSGSIFLTFPQQSNKLYMCLSLFDFNIYTWNLGKPFLQTKTFGVAT